MSPGTALPASGLRVKIDNAGLVASVESACTAVFGAPVKDFKGVNAAEVLCLLIVTTGKCQAASLAMLTQYC